MSKIVSNMTYKYINPETQMPTRVPAVYYEKILDQVTEKYMSDITSRQFLTIMFTQLDNLKKNYEKKNFHFLVYDIISAYDEVKNDTTLQAQVVRETKRNEDCEGSMFVHKNKD